MARTTTFSCDNPTCADFTESEKEWWQLEIVVPGEDRPIFGRPSISVTCCSEQCLWETLRAKVDR